ncbi:MAG: flavin reductase family protein [Solirubrobacterales bacterium]|nr:flavin reductase family protein [Solirubrobacterales bacterium]
MTRSAPVTPRSRVGQREPIKAIRNMIDAVAVSVAEPEEVGRSRAAPDGLRDAVRLLDGGANIVTTRDGRRRPFASAANTVSSVSLHPPMVLVTMHEESQTLAALLQSRRFVINILGGDQRELAGRLARNGAPQTRSAGGRRGDDGVPVLESALAALRCDLHDVADGGDHTVVVGHVVGLGR